MMKVSGGVERNPIFLFLGIEMMWTWYGWLAPPSTGIKLYHTRHLALVWCRWKHFKSNGSPRVNWGTRNRMLGWIELAKLYRSSYPVWSNATTSETDKRSNPELELEHGFFLVLCLSFQVSWEDVFHFLFSKDSNVLNNDNCYGLSLYHDHCCPIHLLLHFTVHCQITTKNKSNQFVFWIMV